MHSPTSDATASQRAAKQAQRQLNIATRQQKQAAAKSARVEHRQQVQQQHLANVQQRKDAKAARIAARQTAKSGSAPALVTGGDAVGSFVSPTQSGAVDNGGGGDTSFSPISASGTTASQDTAASATETNKVLIYAGVGLAALVVILMFKKHNG